MSSSKLVLDVFRPCGYNLCSTCYHSKLISDLLGMYSCCFHHSTFHVLLHGNCIDYINSDCITLDPSLELHSNIENDFYDDEELPF